MSKKLDLNMNPFEGDFGEGEKTIKEQSLEDLPKCHHCGKRMLSGKVVTRVDARLDFDFEEAHEVEVFFWHERCWRGMQED